MHDDYEVWRTEVAALNRLSNASMSAVGTSTGRSDVDERIAVGEAEVRMMVEKYGGGKEKGKSKGKGKASGGKPKSPVENDQDVEAESKIVKKTRLAKNKRG